MVYRYTGRRSPRESRQELVDRLARRNWQVCETPAEADCACRRCGAPFCHEHDPGEPRRCVNCEREFLRMRRGVSSAYSIALMALAFAVGTLALALGYRWALLVVVPVAFGAPPLFAHLAKRTARARFLRQKRERISLPTS